MQTHSRPAREAPDQRLDRQASYFRDIAEFNMTAARTAHAALERASDTGEDTSKPTLDLSRATRAVIAAVDAENGLFRKQAPRRARPDDTRRDKLCTALFKAAKSDPDPGRRLALKRDIPAVVEDTLVDDPQSETPIHVHVFALAAQLGLTLDVAKLPDELIGMPPRVYVRDG